MLDTTLSEIREERARQHAKYGKQEHPPEYWLSILGEEFGEVCSAVRDERFNGELAAVAVQIIEGLPKKEDR